MRSQLRRSPDRRIHASIQQPTKTEGEMLMKFTDDTIEIPCSECNEIIEGVNNMTQHILEMHKEYSAVEAVRYARAWADEAYHKAEEFEADYSEERKLDRAIDADIEFQRHRI